MRWHRKHDTIEALEKENYKLRYQLNFAIDMIVMNGDCALCAMSDVCEYEFAPHSEDRFISCKRNIEKLFLEIVPQDVE